MGKGGCWGGRSLPVSVSCLRILLKDISGRSGPTINPPSIAQSDRALGVLNTTSRGGAEGQRHQKPNVKRINKNHEVTAAELADRLDRRRRHRQTS